MHTANALARGDTAFGDIPLTIKGNFERSSFIEEGDTISNVPPEIWKAVKTNERFGFSVSRT